MDRRCSIHFLHIGHYLVTTSKKKSTANKDASSVKIVWDKSFSTGHKATDLQHQILIDIMNELIVALDTNKAEEQYCSILDRLQHYAEWHFHREEKCMTEYRCPASEVNKIAHMNFLRTVLEFREKSTNGVTMNLSVSCMMNFPNGLSIILKKLIVH